MEPKTYEEVLQRNAEGTEQAIDRIKSRSDLVLENGEPDLIGQFIAIAMLSDSGPSFVTLLVSGVGQQAVEAAMVRCAGAIMEGILIRRDHLADSEIVDEATSAIWDEMVRSGKCMEAISAFLDPVPTRKDMCH